MDVSWQHEFVLLPDVSIHDRVPSCTCTDMSGQQESVLLLPAGHVYNRVLLVFPALILAPCVYPPVCCLICRLSFSGLVFALTRLPGGQMGQIMGISPATLPLLLPFSSLSSVSVYSLSLRYLPFLCIPFLFVIFHFCVFPFSLLSSISVYFLIFCS